MLRRWLQTILHPRHPVLHGLLLLAVLLVYGLVMARRTIDPEQTQAFTEGPLLLYLFLLLRAPLRDRWPSSLAAALPIVWIYAVHDEYYLRLGKVPNFADFAMLPDLYVSLSPVRAVLVTLLVALPVVVWLSLLDYSPRSLRRSVLWLLAPSVLVISGVLAAPARAYHAIDTLTADEEWTDGLTADHWGRLYTLFMREIRRRGFSQGVSGFTPLHKSPIFLDRSLLSKLDGRNVHLIVLESFIDPRLLRSVRFSEPPLSPSFTAWADPYIGSSVSPVFGGETARAEFEVLCGVPSLRLYALEFLTFTGASTYCLPRILNDAGYHTVLTFPHGPVFFNTRRAYPGLGFQERIFGDKHSTPDEESIKQGDQSYLHDADLFPQNLDKVRRLVQAGKPFLNYMLTIYGHWPFDIDEQAHPSHVGVTPDSEDLRKITNQMYQRTEALDAYLEGLRAIDPRGIVVLVADHLPPLPGGTGDYERLDYRGRGVLPEKASGSRLYENFVLALVGGQPRKLPLMRHFDLPHFILDELSHGAYCKAKRCDFGALPLDRNRYLDEYRTVLGLASRH
ncbi:MAG TPA: LTA synthase family protein [Polyangiales bacterium]